MSELLNPQQRSSLRGVLQAFEKSLRDAQAWLDGAVQDGILYSTRAQIPEARGREVAQEVAELLDQIGELSRSFDLEKREENPLRLIGSELVISWANLLDSSSAKLSRYGDVSPDLAERLDPAILYLAETALYLSNIFEDLAENRSDKNVQD